jgi:nucleoside-diphosphate-sugar epimerase
MRVLVTGHNGYIGSVMMPFLRSAAFDVVGLDTYFFEECTLGTDRSEFPAMRKDLRDVTARDLEGFDAVVHLGALSNDPLGDLKPEWTFDINHVGSLRLAKLAKEAGIGRFLFSSSCSMYGSNSSDDLLTEEAPLKPLTPYAESKVRLEAGLRELADTRFSPVYLRNATVYGFAPRLRIDLVLNNLVGWAVTTGKVRILSDGTPWRPLVHVEDLCRTFAAVLKAPRDLVHDRAFNVGVSRENYQVRGLAEIVHEVVPNCEVEFAGQNNPDPRNYRVDFSTLARSFPDLRFQWDARRGAEQLYRAYSENGLTLEQFQGRKYIRLNQLKHLLADGRLNTTLRWS